MNITNAMLDEYSDERLEVDDRPALIDPGIYMGHMMNWEKSFNPMFRKFSLVMNFKIRDEVIPGWFNIEPSDSKTTVKAGWKSNLRRGKYDEWILSRYQGLVELLGYNSADPLTESALESIRRDYSGGMSVEKLASDWNKSVDAIKRIIGIRKEKPRCKPVSDPIKQGVSNTLSTRPGRVVPQPIEAVL